jgi:hypothetical protein
MTLRILLILAVLAPLYACGQPTSSAPKIRHARS